MAANYDCSYDSAASARDPRFPGSIPAMSIPQNPVGRENLVYHRDAGYETGYRGYPLSYRPQDRYESSLQVSSYPPEDYWSASGDLPGSHNPATLPTGTYDRYERCSERYHEHYPERFDQYRDRYGAVPPARHTLDMAAYRRHHDAILHDPRDFGRYPGAPATVDHESSFPHSYHPSSHPSYSAYPSAGLVSNRATTSASVTNALHRARRGVLNVSRDIGTLPVVSSPYQSLAHQTAGMTVNPMIRFLRFPQHTLFVRDLPYSCNSAMLEQFFQEHMSRHIASLSPDAPPELFVKETHVCRNKEGRTQQVGYVLLSSVETAHLALQVMQMKRFLGRDIRVVLFDPKSPAEGSTTGAMHVSFQSLSPELPLVTEADLREVCEPFGAIDHVAIRTHKYTPQGLQSGYGFVTFVEPDLHRYCIDQIRSLEIGGRRFIFSWSAKLLPQQLQQPPLSALKSSQSLCANPQTLQKFSHIDAKRNTMMKNNVTSHHLWKSNNTNDAFLYLLKPNVNFQALNHECSSNDVTSKNNMNFDKLMKEDEKDLEFMWTSFPGNNHKNTDLDVVIDDIVDITPTGNGTDDIKVTTYLMTELSVQDAGIQGESAFNKDKVLVVASD